MSSNGFKAQYKTSANGAWQTKTSGTEQTCLSEYNRLKNAHPFARVIDSAINTGLKLYKDAATTGAVTSPIAADRLAK